MRRVKNTILIYWINLIKSSQSKISFKTIALRQLVNAKPQFMPSKWLDPKWLMKGQMPNFGHLFFSSLLRYIYIHYNITREDFFIVLCFHCLLWKSRHNLRSVEYEVVWKYTHIGQSWKNITKTMTVYKLRGFNLSSLPFKKRYRSSLEFITLRQKCIWREIRSSCLHFWDT